MTAHEYDVFISYARSTGSALAQVFRTGLERRHIRVFLDVHADYWGSFPDELRLRVSQTPCFLLLLTAGCMESKWVEQELEVAFRTQRQVLVVRDASFQPTVDKPLSPTWSKCMTLNQHSYVHEYSDEVVHQVVTAILSTTAPRRWPWIALAAVAAAAAVLAFALFTRRPAVVDIAPARRQEEVETEPRTAPVPEPTAPARAIESAVAGSAAPQHDDTPIRPELPHEPQKPSSAKVKQVPIAPAPPQPSAWCFYKSGYDPLRGTDRSVCVERRSLEACDAERSRVIGAGDIYTSVKECTPCACTKE